MSAQEAENDATFRGIARPGDCGAFGARVEATQKEKGEPGLVRSGGKPVQPCSALKVLAGWGSRGRRGGWWAGDPRGKLSHGKPERARASHPSERYYG